ncbi:Na(+)/H(+) antiporter subunit A [Capnocytophaga canimorsus]|uniref:putative monovalent cation/H+ antiporter subunit A n=1 Tax=Capnocytophaga canimorsus TaxID=28188 RepID=UPI001ACB056E|nr:putative monovalent cation/H+ antiporter subunit A [Capnocytophaga canimorsus]GIM55851.1 Na(+)/H(+) antiporter subunit A [Capnocytophaga canimorsus]
MLIAILSGLIFSSSLLIFGNFIKKKGALLPFLLPLGVFIYFLSFIPQISNGAIIYQRQSWVPAFGVDLSFTLDGLSLLFSLMITGIGALVFLYTSSYLKNHQFLDRFYGYLGVFMAAMLGVVLSDNLITMFIFWEITSISSFFLIGFNNDQKSSRKSAITALSVTGIGGLLLFAGIVIMGQIAGSYSFAEILASKEIIRENIWYSLIVVLFFLAAFTKSAQFPFHFWLPGAMKAPTPVSTYLHSATMVKAGIYLLLRMTPVLGETSLWNHSLIIIGGITMLYAAIHTLFRTDLKGILAYSTISALGILTFLIGLGTQQALLAATLFILVHATYKATLFLVTGIIDHETRTRDVTILSGLRKVLMPVAIAGLLAAISNAGIPPSFGFLGKDLVYEATLNAPYIPTILTILAVVTNLLLLYAGFVAGIKPFAGKLPTSFAKVHLPSPTMWIPPLILSALCLVFGLFPSLLEGTIAIPILKTLGKDSEIHLALWHGFNLVLLLSALTIGLGLTVYYFIKPTQNKEIFIGKFEKISPQSIIEKASKAFGGLSTKLTLLLQNGFLRRYVFFMILAATLLLGYASFTRLSFQFSEINFNEITLYEVIFLTMMVIGIGFTVFSKSRLVALVAMSVIGFSICMTFMIYSAPDLAMTQFSIDTLTVVLFVLVLYKLPPYLKIFNYKRSIIQGVLSLAFGGVITLIALEALTTPKNSEVTNFYAENSYLLAHGKNIVNVILVDFRGADTLMEISVLSIAAIGVFGLLKLRLKERERHKA